MHQRLQFSKRYCCQRNVTIVIWTIISIISRGASENQNSEIAKILHRPIRALSFPSSSNMGLFFALAVPLQDPYNSVSISYFFEASYELPENSTYFAPWYYPYNKRRKRSIDRTTVYQMLENKFESSGFPGRECLLRSICETSEFPIRHNGIVGDIMHIVFTPSASESEDLPKDIVEAESIGQNGTCTKYYSMCPVGLFDLIGSFV